MATGEPIEIRLTSEGGQPLDPRDAAAHAPPVEDISGVLNDLVNATSKQALSATEKAAQKQARAQEQLAEKTTKYGPQYGPMMDKATNYQNKADSLSLTGRALDNLGLPGSGLLGKVGGVFSKMSGAAGEAAVGAGAGGISGALSGMAGGPVGMAVAVADMVGKAVAGGIKKLGEVGGKAMGGDTGVIADTAMELADKVPIIGQVVSATIGAFRQLCQGLDQTAAKLAPFSASLSMATAQKDVQALMGDMRRADKLGDTLSDFVEARGDAEQAGQDLLAELIELVTPMVTWALDEVTPWIEELTSDVKGLREFFHIDGQKSDTHRQKHMSYLERIAKNTGKEEQDVGHYFEKLLSQEPPQMALKSEQNYESRRRAQVRKAIS